MLTSSPKFSRLLSFLFLAVVTASPIAVAHQGHKHPGPESGTPMIRHDSDSGTDETKRDYQLRVEPIFKKSCMDCHSGQTRFPWYYKIPGIKQMLDSDISEAGHHLDMSASYPFKVDRHRRTSKSELAAPKFVNVSNVGFLPRGVAARPITLFVELLAHPSPGKGLAIPKLDNETGDFDFDRIHHELAVEYLLSERGGLGETIIFG